jgi:predicted dehydrogenase
MTTDQNSRRRSIDYPIHIGIIGLGGFAASHHEAVMQLERSGKCKLVCTCDPNPGMHIDRMATLEFAKRNVMVYDDYQDMLNKCTGDLNLVTLPTPVPLHAVMHRTCVEKDLAVYLEKPPTLDYHELDAMLATETSALHQTNVGFNFIIEVARRQLKQRLVNGEFGALRRVSFSGLWPRPRSYFTRASWAGRLMLDNRLVLDSCFGNAMAHYVHNVLYWAGCGALDEWGNVDEVHAELYRAHDIEGPDTMFVKARTHDRIELRLALSHACVGDHRHYERLVCDQATITYKTFDSYTIEWGNGNTETHRIPSVSLADNLEAHLAYLSGEHSVAHPSTRLIDSKPFVTLNDLVYLAASAIHQIPPKYTGILQTPDRTSEFCGIISIDQIFDMFLRDGKFPSDQLVPWSQHGGSATILDLPQLGETVREMLSQIGETK